MQDHGSLWSSKDALDPQTSWDDLRSFLAVAKGGSLSKAAQALGVSQPTIGRRLDKLEACLGGPLLRRASQGCELTERGAALLPFVERMEHGAAGVARLAASANNDMKGLVRVAAGDLPARRIAAHLSELFAEAPSLRLEIISGLDFVNLERGEADLAIRSRIPKGSNWVVKTLPLAEFAVYGAPDYLRDHPQALDDRRWSQCRWIALDATKSNSARYLFEQRGEAPDFAFSNSLLVLEAAASGVGLAILPVNIGEEDPRLQRVSPPLDKLTMDGFLVVHPSARRLPRVRWVATRLADFFLQSKSALS